MTNQTTDFLVIGAGIVGLTMALELKNRNPAQSVTVLEKEPMPGLHTSGRNSGVMHSGIYYPPDSLKAKVCTRGAIEMAEYCESRKLPLKKIGKILVPTKSEDIHQLDLLLARGKANRVVVEMLDEKNLKKLEPEVRSANGKALFVEQTSVIDSKIVMSSLVKEVREKGIIILCDGVLSDIDASKRTVKWNKSTINYGHVVNAAGLHADKIAHQFGSGLRYTLLPFKGLYWKLDPLSKIKINHLIYPVPDLGVPFLGVHTTTNTEGVTYLGPTAVPAFGRENYNGIKGVSFGEFLRISALLTTQFTTGKDGFRKLAYQEGRRYFKPWFVEAAQALLPKLRSEHLLPCEKVGIRAQMLDKQTGHLVHDFLVESGVSSTHILNAISPAFTSAFPFARYICDNYIDKSFKEVIYGA